MYQFKQINKDGTISVYKGGLWQCIISPEFAKKSGYKTPLDYCKKVFK